jgi:hypothetical protein
MGSEAVDVESRSWYRVPRVETTRKHYLRLPVVEPLRAVGDVFE